MHWSGNRAEADLLESHIHSFIVKIWLEEPANGAGDAVWRGRITHVPSEESRSLQEVEDISAFVVPYLKSMGVKFRLGPRLAERIGRWTTNVVSRIADVLPVLQPVEVRRREPAEGRDRPAAGPQRSTTSDVKAEEGGILSQKP